MAQPSIVHRYTEVHKAPNGPGDARPTGAQILIDNGLINNMTGKTFLVTGGTAGLGLETVRALARTGANVFFTARNVEKANKAIQAIVEEVKGAKVDFVEMDNTSLASVKNGAEEFRRKTEQLNVLICNAGIGSAPGGRTEDGHEMHFGVNYLAHFYLFQLLKPLLLASSTPSFHSRVVTLSSSAHWFTTVQIGNYNQEKKLEERVEPLFDSYEGYNPLFAYGQSKTALIWLANEIERRYGGKGLHGLSADPGVIFTDIWGGMDPRAAEAFKPFLADEQTQKGVKSVEQGIATHVLAAVGKEYEGLGGLYLCDCTVPRALADDEAIPADGYRSWAFDPKGEKRLWADSLEMVGLKEGS